MKLKLFILFFFILSGTIVSAQLVTQSAGGGPGIINEYQGWVKGKNGSIIAVKDTLNNPATSRVGAITIRPQDTVNHGIVPIYMSNGIYWSRISSSVIVIDGDSLSFIGNQICKWHLGIPTCFFLEPSSGGDADSLGLNFDSTKIIHYRNGLALGDSVFLIHSNLFVDPLHLSLVPYNGPYGYLLSPTRLVDTTFVDGIYFVTRYAAGDLDSAIITGSGAIINPDIFVRDSLSTPSLTPQHADKFLVGTSPTGVFATHANQIATYDSTAGGSYTFNIRIVGDVLYNANNTEASKFTGTAWVWISALLLHQGGEVPGYGDVVTGSKGNFQLRFITNNIVNNWISNSGVMSVDSTIIWRGASKGYNIGSIAFGEKSLISNTTGIENVVLGDSSGVKNTTGSRNTFVGKDAGQQNSTGSSNSFIGWGVGQQNTTGAANTASGMQALVNNQTGQENSAFGHQAMFFAGGDYNAAFGAGSMLAAGAVNFNTGVGAESLRANQGSGNSAIGYRSLYNNNTGIENTGVGILSLFTNTTGDFNVGIGSNALYTNSVGFSNVAIGTYSLLYNQTGDYNVAAGYHSLYNNVEGGNNVVAGGDAGAYDDGTTGGPGDNLVRIDNSVLIGRLASPGADSLVHVVVIGDSAIGPALSHTVTIGNGSNTGTYLGGYGAGSITGTATYGLAVDANHKVVEVALSGGGGGGNTIYTADDTLTSDRTVDLAGFPLHFSNSGNWLNIDPSAGFEKIELNVLGSESGASTYLTLNNNSDNGNRFNLVAQSATENVGITGNADAQTFSVSAGGYNPISIDIPHDTMALRIIHPSGAESLIKIGDDGSPPKVTIGLSDLPNGQTAEYLFQAGGANLSINSATADQRNVSYSINSGNIQEIYQSTTTSSTMSRIVGINTGDHPVTEITATGITSGQTGQLIVTDTSVNINTPILRINGVEYSAGSSGTITDVTATTPINSSGGTTPNITIDNATADGSTKGAASFSSADFNSSSGNISLDYPNGQAADASHKGYLTSSDWSTFNGKQAALSGTGLLSFSGTTPAYNTTSASIAGIISDELGSGKMIFSAGTLDVASGKTLTSSNTLTLAGTDGSTLNVGTGGTLGTAAYTASTAYISSTGTTGDVNSYSATNTPSRIAAVATGSLFASAGTGTLPTWSASPTLTTSLTVPSINPSGSSLIFNTYDTLQVDANKELLLSVNASGHNVLALQNRNSTAGSVSAVAFRLSDAKEYAAIGIGNNTTTYPFSHVFYLESSDNLNGNNSIAPPISIIQTYVNGSAANVYNERMKFTDRGNIVINRNGSWAAGMNPIATFSDNSSGNSSLTLHDSSLAAGTTRSVDLNFKMGSTVMGGFSSYSSNWNYHAYPPNGMGMVASNAGGLSLFATNASGAIKFYTADDQAANLRMTIASTGRIGIGSAITSPSALLNLGAGTATASTAPLKFTAGTLLTAPEVGAVEFLTDAYYGTITTGTERKRFAFAVDSPDHVYASSITWDGTPPSGATTHSYQWTRVGNLVTLRINLVYASAGATNTSAIMDLPSDCPAPVIPTGLTTSDYFIPCAAAFQTTGPGSAIVAGRGSFRNTATKTVRAQVASGAYTTCMVVLSYWTQ